MAREPRRPTPRDDGAPCAFHGDLLGAWRSPLVTLSETRYAPGFHAPAHAHAGVTLAFVLSGGFVEQVGRRALSCGASGLLWRSPEVEHDDAFAPDGATRCFNVELSAPWSLAGAAVDLRGEAPAWLAARLVLAARETPPSDPLPVESVVAELLAAVRPSAEPAPPARLRRVVERLEDEITRPWSLAALAREADLHPVHLARLFRRHCGESLGDRVHRRRVALACRLLAQTGEPLAAVAAAAGFADQAHLTRIFRRRTGLTPGRFRSVFALRSFKT